MLKAPIIRPSDVNFRSRPGVPSMAPPTAGGYNLQRKINENRQNAQQELEDRKKIRSLTDIFLNKAARDKIKREYGVDDPISTTFAAAMDLGKRAYNVTDPGNMFKTWLEFVAGTFDIPSYFLKSGIISAQEGTNYFEVLGDAFGTGDYGRFSVDSERIIANTSGGIKDNFINNFAIEILTDPGALINIAGLIEGAASSATKTAFKQSIKLGKEAVVDNKAILKELYQNDEIVDIGLGLLARESATKSTKIDALRLTGIRKRLDRLTRYAKRGDEKAFRDSMTELIRNKSVTHMRTSQIDNMWQRVYTTHKGNLGYRLAWGFDRAEDKFIRSMLKVSPVGVPFVVGRKVIRYSRGVSRNNFRNTLNESEKAMQAYRGQSDRRFEEYTLDELEKIQKNLGRNLDAYKNSGVMTGEEFDEAFISYREVEVLIKQKESVARVTKAKKDIKTYEKELKRIADKKAKMTKEHSNLDLVQEEIEIEARISETKDALERSIVARDDIIRVLKDHHELEKESLDLRVTKMENLIERLDELEELEKTKASLESVKHASYRKGMEVAIAEKEKRLANLKSRLVNFDINKYDPEVRLEIRQTYSRIGHQRESIAAKEKEIINLQDALKKAEAPSESELKRIEDLQIQKAREIEKNKRTIAELEELYDIRIQDIGAQRGNYTTGLEVFDRSYAADLLASERIHTLEYELSIDKLRLENTNPKHNIDKIKQQLAEANDELEYYNGAEYNPDDAVTAKYYRNAIDQTQETVDEYERALKEHHEQMKKWKKRKVPKSMEKKKELIEKALKEPKKDLAFLKDRYEAFKHNELIYDILKRRERLQEQLKIYEDYINIPNARAKEIDRHTKRIAQMRKDLKIEEGQSLRNYRFGKVQERESLLREYRTRELNVQNSKQVQTANQEIYSFEKSLSQMEAERTNLLDNFNRRMDAGEDFNKETEEYVKLLQEQRAYEDALLKSNQTEGLEKQVQQTIAGINAHIKKYGDTAATKRLLSRANEEGLKKYTTEIREAGEHLKRLDETEKKGSEVLSKAMSLKKNLEREYNFAKQILDVLEVLTTNTQQADFLIAFLKRPGNENTYRAFRALADTYIEDYYKFIKNNEARLKEIHKRFKRIEDLKRFIAADGRKEMIEEYKDAIRLIDNLNNRFEGLDYDITMQRKLYDDLHTKILKEALKGNMYTEDIILQAAKDIEIFYTKQGDLTIEGLESRLNDAKKLKESFEAQKINKGKEYTKNEKVIKELTEEIKKEENAKNALANFMKDFMSKKFTESAPSAKIFKTLQQNINFFEKIRTGKYIAGRNQAEDIIYMNYKSASRLYLDYTEGIMGDKKAAGQFLMTLLNKGPDGLNASQMEEYKVFEDAFTAYKTILEREVRYADDMTDVGKAAIAEAKETYNKTDKGIWGKLFEGLNTELVASMSTQDMLYYVKDLHNGNMFAQVIANLRVGKNVLRNLGYKHHIRPIDSLGNVAYKNAGTPSEIEQLIISVHNTVNNLITELRTVGLGQSFTKVKRRIKNTKITKHLDQLEGQNYIQHRLAIDDIIKAIQTERQDFGKMEDIINKLRRSFEEYAGAKDIDVEITDLTLYRFLEKVNEQVHTTFYKIANEHTQLYRQIQDQELLYKRLHTKETRELFRKVKLYSMQDDPKKEIERILMSKDSSPEDFINASIFINDDVPLTKGILYKFEIRQMFNVIDNMKKQASLGGMHTAEAIEAFARRILRPIFQEDFYTLDLHKHIPEDIIAEFSPELLRRFKRVQKYNKSLDELAERLKTIEDMTTPREAKAREIILNKYKGTEDMMREIETFRDLYVTEQFEEVFTLLKKDQNALSLNITTEMVDGKKIHEVSSQLEGQRGPFSKEGIFNTMHNNIDEYTTNTYVGGFYRHKVEEPPSIMTYLDSDGKYSNKTLEGDLYDYNTATLDMEDMPDPDPNVKHPTQIALVVRRKLPDGTIKVERHEFFAKVKKKYNHGDYFFEFTGIDPMHYEDVAEEFDIVSGKVQELLKDIDVVIAQNAKHDANMLFKLGIKDKYIFDTLPIFRINSKGGKSGLKDIAQRAYDDTILNKLAQGVKTNARPDGKSYFHNAAYDAEITYRLLYGADSGVDDIAEMAATEGQYSMAKNYLNAKDLEELNIAGREGYSEDIIDMMQDIADELGDSVAYEKYIDIPDLDGTSQTIRQKVEDYYRVDEVYNDLLEKGIINARTDIDILVEDISELLEFREDLRKQLNKTIRIVREGDITAMRERQILSLQSLHQEATRVEGLLGRVHAKLDSLGLSALDDTYSLEEDSLRLLEDLRTTIDEKILGPNGLTKKQSEHYAEQLSYQYGNEVAVLQDSAMKNHISILNEFTKNEEYHRIQNAVLQEGIEGSSADQRMSAFFREYMYQKLIQAQHDGIIKHSVDPKIKGKGLVRSFKANFKEDPLTKLIENMEATNDYTKTQERIFEILRTKETLDSNKAYFKGPLGSRIIYHDMYDLMYNVDKVLNKKIRNHRQQLLKGNVSEFSEFESFTDFIKIMKGTEANKMISKFDEDHLSNSALQEFYTYIQRRIRSLKDRGFPEEAIMLNPTTKYTNRLYEVMKQSILDPTAFFETNTMDYAAQQKASIIYQELSEIIHGAMENIRKPLRDIKYKNAASELNPVQVGEWKAYIRGIQEGLKKGSLPKEIGVENPEYFADIVNIGDLARKGSASVLRLTDYSRTQRSITRLMNMLFSDDITKTVEDAIPYQDNRPELKIMHRLLENLGDPEDIMRFAYSNRANTKGRNIKADIMRNLLAVDDPYFKELNEKFAPIREWGGDPYKGYLKTKQGGEMVDPDAYIEFEKRIYATYYDYLTGSYDQKYYEALSKGYETGVIKESEVFKYTKAQTIDNIQKSFSDSYRHIRTQYGEGREGAKEFLKYIRKAGHDVVMLVKDEGVKSGYAVRRVHNPKVEHIMELDNLLRANSKTDALDIALKRADVSDWGIGAHTEMLPMGVLDQHSIHELERVTKQKYQLSNPLAKAIHKGLIMPLKVFSLTTVNFFTNNFFDINLKNVVAAEGGVLAPVSVWYDTFVAMRWHNTYTKYYNEAAELVSYSARKKDYAISWIDLLIEAKTKQGHTFSAKELEDLEITKFVDDFVSTPAAASEAHQMMMHMRQGIIGQGQDSLIMKAYTKGLYGKYTPWGANLQINGWSETVGRLGLHINDIRKGLTVNESLNKILKTHFNYANKTQAEVWAEMVIPFVSYPIRSIEFWNEAFYQDAVTARTLSKAMLLAWGDEIDDNDYAQYQMSRGNIPIGNYALQTGFTFADALTFTGMQKQTGIPDQLVRKINPLIRNMSTRITPDSDLDTQDRIMRSPGLNQVKNIANVASGNAKSLDNIFPSLVDPYYGGRSAYPRTAFLSRNANFAKPTNSERTSFRAYGHLQYSPMDKTRYRWAETQHPYRR